MLPPTIRAYIYSILLAAGPLLVAYGSVSAQNWPLWLALGGSILGNGLAAANTTTAGGKAGGRHEADHAAD